MQWARSQRSWESIRHQPWATRRPPRPRCVRFATRPLIKHVCKTVNSVPCLCVPRGHHRRRCSDAARNLRARKTRSQSCVSSHAVLKKSRCSAAQAWRELEAASRNSAGVTSACLRPLSCTDDMCALPGPVLRLFPPCALVSHARGSSGAVDNMPFAWRGHTKSLATRARPSPDLAVWLE